MYHSCVTSACGYPTFGHCEVDDYRDDYHPSHHVTACLAEKAAVETEEAVRVAAATVVVGKVVAVAVVAKVGAGVDRAHFSTRRVSVRRW